MIRSVTFAGAKGTYPAALPFWGTRLAFSPGLNAIVGPNGSGKTTCLRLLAAFTGLHSLRNESADALPSVGAEPRGSTARARTAPQPAPETPEAWALMQQRIFEAVIKAERGGAAAPKPLKLALDWDRQPAVYASGASAFTTPNYLGETGDIREELSTMFERSGSSAGQSVMAKINRVIAGTLQGAPLRYSTSRLQRVNSHWAHRGATWNACMDQAAHDPAGRRTLLLDEPDLSLAPTAQVRIWEQLPEIAEAHGLQIIAVSHSPFALLAPTVIEMVPGYAAAMDSAIRHYAATAPVRATAAPPKVRPAKRTLGKTDPR
jgi:predicted ATPase